MDWLFYDFFLEVSFRAMDCYTSDLSCCFWCLVNIDFLFLLFCSLSSLLLANRFYFFGITWIGIWWTFIWGGRLLLLLFLLLLILLLVFGVSLTWRWHLIIYLMWHGGSRTLSLSVWIISLTTKLTFFTIAKLCNVFASESAIFTTCWTRGTSAHTLDWHRRLTGAWNGWTAVRDAYLQLISCLSCKFPLLC